MRAPADPPAAPAQASRRESLGSALLLVAVIALAGEAATFPVYRPEGLARLVLLASAALAGVLLGGARCRPPTWAIVVSALLTGRRASHRAVRGWVSDRQSAGRESRPQGSP